MSWNVIKAKCHSICKMARKRYLLATTILQYQIQHSRYLQVDSWLSITLNKLTCYKQTLQDASHPNGYKCSTYGLLKVPHIITQILFYFVSQEPTSQCCGKGLGLHKRLTSIPGNLAHDPHIMFQHHHNPPHAKWKLQWLPIGEGTAINAGLG